MIILASQSPRRQRLMHEITHKFLVEVSHIDESSSLDLSPIEAVKDIAKRKGFDISKNHPNDIVISADTIVVIDNKIIGKPIDEEDAKRILNLLSDRTHIVYTAFCLIKGDKLYEEVVASEVTFNKLDEKTILEYIASGSPMDKAGAYGYQDNEDYKIVKSVKGSVSNVIGFPLEEIKKALKDF
ncbi:MAG: Maf family protein [Bacilli bacterium]|nr:Maf family protein [Bacilli bacterium]